MAEPRTPVAILCLGVFAAMALSNAIVPVLPAFANGTAWQGAVYAAYFFGAFISTLPGGIAADRYGRSFVIRIGLIITAVSGALLFFAATPVATVSLRGLEGIGAGLFVAAALSAINSREDHVIMSGYYMAMLNLGLVLGAAVSGWLAVQYSQASPGIGVFTVVAVVACAGSMVLKDPRVTDKNWHERPGTTSHIFLHDLWLWYSVAITVGLTGAVSSLYPAFSGYSPEMLGFWIAGMSVATIITVILVSRIPLPPVKAIRCSAVLMAAGVIVAYYTPAGLILLGAVAGIAMIAQMSYLSGDPHHQGFLMGLFSTSGYLGMAVLPFVAGLLANTHGYLPAFIVVAAVGLTVAISEVWNRFRFCGHSGK